MKYELLALTSYAQVMKGDYFPNHGDTYLGGSGFRTGKVEKVTETSFSGPVGFLDSDFIVSGDQIKDVILLRQGKKGLEILAGENVLPLLSSSQTPPKCTILLSKS